MIGGLGRGRVPGKPAREPGLAIPRQVNMLNLLIEHRQDVALGDSQFVRVIALKRTLDSTNAPLVRRLDSLQRLFRGGAPMFSEPSPARADSLAEARATVREAAAAIHENNAAARDAAYALLDVQQLTRARAIESKAEAAIEDDTRKRSPRS